MGDARGVSHLPNSYSRTWFELFLETRSSTSQELAFVVQNLASNKPIQSVLDVCCGQGRLSNPLAELGHSVLGVDRDERALEIARDTAPPSARYQRLDMRNLAAISGEYDTVLCWWQSFGYFDEAANLDVLRQMSEKTRDGGRLLLDIYQRRFWSENQGRSEAKRNGISIQIDNRMAGNRLTSSVQYTSGGASDWFEWQLFDLDEIVDNAMSVGFHLRLACSECEASKPVSVESRSMQLVLEKTT